MTTSLSERELQILRLVAEGFSNRQIAGQLDISENTVKVHIRNIFGKIGVASRTEASMYAVRNGLIADVVLVDVPSIDAEVPLDADVQPSRLPAAMWSRWSFIIGLIVLVSMVAGVVWWSIRDVYQVRSIVQPTDTQRWRKIAPLPVSAPDVQLVAVAGRLYALGGALDQTVMAYDASQDVWMVTEMLPLPSPYALNWNDATGVWLIESSTQTVWLWDGQTWQARGQIPEGVVPAAVARVAGMFVVIDIRGTVWLPADDALNRWQAYTAPMTQLMAPRLVVVDDVLLLFGDGRIVWRSFDQGRSWQRDGELIHPWQGGYAVPVLNAIMLMRGDQQSLYTLTLGEGGSQSMPLVVASDGALAIWQTMIVVGAEDGSRIDTYQFVYQSFMPMMP